MLNMVLKVEIVKEHWTTHFIVVKLISVKIMKILTKTSTCQHSISQHTFGLHHLLKNDESKMNNFSMKLVFIFAS